MDIQINEQQKTPEELFVEKYLQADRAYRLILAAVFVACAVGVTLAAVYDVIVGMCISICGAIGYSFFASDEIFKRIGIRHKHIQGSAHVTEAAATYGSTLIIPSRLAFADVTQICDGAFDKEENAELACVYIPKSVTRIGNNPFGEHAHPTQIKYEGSQADWKRIEGTESLSELDICFDVPAPVIPKVKRKKDADGEDNK